MINSIPGFTVWRHVTSSQLKVKSSQVKSSQVKSSQVKSGQVRSEDPVRGSGQRNSCASFSAPVETREAPG